MHVLSIICRYFLQQNNVVYYWYFFIENLQLFVGKQMMSSDCIAHFSYIQEQLVGNAQDRFKYTFHYDIPFGSSQDDVIVLELVHLDDKSKTQFPKRFWMDTTNEADREFFLFGHPNAKVLQVDPLCKQMTKEDLEKLDEDKYSFWSKEDDRYNVKFIDESYPRPESFDKYSFFNVSESTCHGASGSPGIHPEENKHPAVSLMLQGGYPKFFYADYVVGRKSPPATVNSYIFEYGISMKKVSKLLKEAKMDTLHKDLFKAWDDSAF